MRVNIRLQQFLPDNISDTISVAHNLRLFGFIPGHRRAKENIYHNQSATHTGSFSYSHGQANILVQTESSTNKTTHPLPTSPAQLCTYLVTIHWIDD